MSTQQEEPIAGEAAGDISTDKEFMTTLAKGLSVLGSFGEQRPTMPLSEAAVATGLSRATARRILLTLAGLGYVVHRGRAFSLAPRILERVYADAGHDPRWATPLDATELAALAANWQGGSVRQLERLIETIVEARERHHPRQ